MLGYYYIIGKKINYVGKKKKKKGSTLKLADKLVSKEVFRLHHFTFVVREPFFVGSLLCSSSRKGVSLLIGARIG